MRLEEAVRELEADRAHGASGLATRALEILLALGPRADRRAAARRLAATRPSMAVLANEMGRYLAALGKSRAPEGYLRGRLAERRALPARIAALARADTVGRAVAISYSETLARALGATPGGGTVWVMESRPLREGVALARTVREAGREAVLITDAQAALFCARAELAVAGADAVLADGSVVNKAGTHLLALAARAAGIPFVVLTETMKVTDLGPEEVALEEKDPAELGDVGDLPVRNVYFEIVPAPLVSTIICEEGRLERPTLRRRVRQAAAWRGIVRDAPPPARPERARQS